MRIFLVILVSALATTNIANATVQVRSLFIIEGEHYYPDGTPRLEEVFPKITFPEYAWTTTANRKGYTATWATFRNQLYLVGLTGQTSLKGKPLRNEDNTPGHRFPLKVNSWSGKLIQTSWQSSHNSEDATWAGTKHTTTITIKKGMVIGVEEKEEQIPAPSKKPDRDKRE